MAGLRPGPLLRWARIGPPRVPSPRPAPPQARAPGAPSPRPARPRPAPRAARGPCPGRPGDPGTGSGTSTPSAPTRSKGHFSATGHGNPEEAAALTEYGIPEAGRRSWGLAPPRRGLGSRGVTSVTTSGGGCRLPRARTWRSRR
ncbi:hypothetical protein TPA0910_31720 [Streptomyces hygroscopicus subsp. sporocinereus]|uniref:Uncharacterized protein n=1 Tax=Streptomyces hygroscopicus TaxID=1912 RepID=A0ABQ3TZF4_STRHY|nr:hypothetical protein TPA0910_31720 [Streptomyces hygroscopicus]